MVAFDRSRSCLQSMLAPLVCCSATGTWQPQAPSCLLSFTKNRKRDQVVRVCEVGSRARIDVKPSRCKVAK